MSVLLSLGPYLDLKTAPASEPVTTAQAKLHLRVTISTDDTPIDDMVKAAREYVETYTGLQLISATWTLKLDTFPSAQEIRLPKPPLTSVTHVKYLDTGGSEQTFSSGSYAVHIPSEQPGSIILNRDESWPSTYGQARQIEIEFVSGFANAAAIPESLISAINLLVGHWYEHREDVVVGTIVSPMRRAVDALLTANCMREFP